MKLLAIWTTLILASNSFVFGQKSDLETSSHEIVLIGDTAELTRILQILDTAEIIPDRGGLCELTIKEIGTVTGKIRIVHIVMNIGVSCRGVSRTVFFDSGLFIGYYNSDIINPKTVNKNILVWVSENNDTLKMDLTHGIPRQFEFKNFTIEFIPN